MSDLDKKVRKYRDLLAKAYRQGLDWDDENEMDTLNELLMEEWQKEVFGVAILKECLAVLEKLEKQESRAVWKRWIEDFVLGNKKLIKNPKELKSIMEVD